MKTPPAIVKDTMLDLVERVQTASGKTARIAGTRQGLAKMGSAIDSAWVSNETFTVRACPV